MKVLKDDYFVLSTGKEFYAHANIIGLSETDDEFGQWEYIYNGYDGGSDLKDFTQEERIEIADYMIGLWIAFKEKQEVSES